MKKSRTFLSLLTLLTLMLSVVPAELSLAADPALPAPIQRVFDRTDKAVLESRPGAFWVWGPRVQDSTEDYKESPGGKRQVYYFEKGRLEVTDPAKNPADKYFVTSGLLLREMITGKQQNGDNTYLERDPANVPLAGDLAPGVADSPTYASLLNLVSFDGSWKSDNLTGQPVTKQLGLGGAVTTRTDLAKDVVYARYYGETGHNVAKPFDDFMNKKGTVFENGRYVDNQALFDPIYVFGYPIAEPYWAHVTVAGKEKYVLVQAFERRLLTYTPDNTDLYKVELGNLGLAYVQWRYKTAPAPFNNADPDYQRPVETDAFKLINNVGSNMQKLSAVKRLYKSGDRILGTEQYQAPDKARILEAGTYRGQAATYETIYVGKRAYVRAFNNSGSTDWYFVDLSQAYSWPVGFREFRTYNLNDWTLDWKLGGQDKPGNDVTRFLTVGFTDIDGSKVTRNRLVSEKNNLLLTSFIDTVQPNNAKSSVAYEYSEYNVPNAINAPAGALPLSANQSEPLDAAAIASGLSQVEANLPFSYSQAQSPDGVLVKFKPGYYALNTSFSSSYGSISLAQGWENTPSDMPALFKLNGTNLDAMLESLQADPRVEYAEPNYRRQKFVTQVNDPNSVDQYYLKAVKAPRAWDFGTGSKGVTVAVIDSGVDLENPDLKGNIADVYNSEKNNKDMNDIEGHGSWTAGIIGALGNNKVYGSGIAWNTKIIAIKADADDSPGSFTDSSLVKAIRYATDNGAKIINMSLGGTRDTKAMRDAVAYATDRGVLVIVSSGNGGSDVPNYPASYPKVISVGATGYLGQPTAFTSYGSKVILAAPGVHICNTVRVGQFSCPDGTSASAPVVTGAAALIMGINPTLSADQVKAILIASATPPPGKQSGERDDKYGYGIVNIATAARMAAANQFPALPANLPQ